MTDLRLVAIDLDGTLLNDHRMVSARDLYALKGLLRAGVAVCLASARDCASISHVVPVKQPGLYYVASGGALIYDALAGGMMWTDYLSRAQLEAFVSFLKQFDYPIFLNNFNDYWVDRYNEHVHMIEQRYVLTTQPFSGIGDFDKPIMRVSLAAPVRILEHAAVLAADSLACQPTVSLASPDWLDLLLPHAGKGALLRRLQDDLGITAAQTVAIGDYESDLSLFEHAGISIAMDNAVDSLKKSANYITATNNDNGVAQAVGEYFPQIDQEEIEA